MWGLDAFTSGQLCFGALVLLREPNIDILAQALDMVEDSLGGLEKLPFASASASILQSALRQ